MKHSPNISALLSISLLAGCVATSSAPSLPLPPGTETTQPDARPGNGVISWKITPTDQVRKYSSLVTTVITQADVLPIRRDSLTTRASYSIKTQRTVDSTFFSGSITSFTIERNTPDPDPVNPVFPISFSGKIGNHNIITSFPGPASTKEQPDCENTGQTALRTVERTLFVLPFEITSSQMWTDSTSTTTCNGELPTLSTVVRTFTVVGESEWEAIPALIINENEKTFSKGEGSQGQHQIAVETRGSGNTQIYVDLNSGQLLAAKTQNNTSVSIKSSGRIQHFTQNSTEITRTVR